MSKALRYLFWGYLFIFFRIHIGIDWLPDPVGYFLIYLGCSILTDKYPHAKKAGVLSAIGIAITIPAIFVDLSVTELGGWAIYSVVLLVLKLVVAYYLFAVLTNIAKEYGNQTLINRTKNVYTFYLSFHLSILVLISFSMNFSGNFWSIIAFILTIGGLIMDIAFLLLLGAIRRGEPSKPTLDSHFQVFK